MEKVIVTGISGQTGYLMTEYLLENTENIIIGTVRKTAEFNDQKYQKFLKNPRFSLEVLDLADFISIDCLINKHKPDYFLNFAANAYIPDAANVPHQTMQINALAVVEILESIKRLCPRCRFFNACSVEIFAGTKDSKVNENTLPAPESIYGVSKNAAREIVKFYREKFGLYAVSGILANHESEYRPKHYVSRKITSEIAEIAYNIYHKRIDKIEPLELGNIYSKKDFCSARDTIKAIWILVNQQEIMSKNFTAKWDGRAAIIWGGDFIPKDYVIGSGKLTPIREIVDISLQHFNITSYWGGLGINEAKILVDPLDDHSRGRKIVLVKINPEFYREAKNGFICDSSAMERDFGWRPQTDFYLTIQRMCKHDYIW